MSIIDVKNLVKIYDSTEVEVKAVNGINLSFEQGEFAAIVGPSGSRSEERRVGLECRSRWSPYH